MKLRKSNPEIARPFKAPLYPFVPIIGSASCILLMYYLSDNAKIAAVLWFFTGLLVYVIMAKRIASSNRVTLEKHAALDENNN